MKRMIGLATCFVGLVVYGAIAERSRFQLAKWSANAQRVTNLFAFERNEELAQQFRDMVD